MIAASCFQPGLVALIGGRKRGFSYRSPTTRLCLEESQDEDSSGSIRSLVENAFSRLANVNNVNVHRPLIIDDASKGEFSLETCASSFHSQSHRHEHDRPQPRGRIDS